MPAFKEPSWRNARSTSSSWASLGVMFLGISVLAAEVEARPFIEGTPTVLSQIGKLVYGGGAAGHLLYLSLQAGTVLILVLAPNTSYADFPGSPASPPATPSSPPAHQAGPPPGLLQRDHRPRRSR